MGLITSPSLLFFNPLYNFALPPKWQALTQKRAQKIINSNGNLANWLQTCQSLPQVKTTHLALNQEIVIGRECEIGNKEELKKTLLQLSPWRKGPFKLFGIDINSEWRCDLKWQRLQAHINCANKRILDVGCGNGYYMLRMLGAGAQQVIGIDPSVLFIVQYLVLRQFCQQKPNAMILPFKLQDLPKDLEKFDMVFSMGVLYHRRSPIDHLIELKNILVSKGQLILETLVVSGIQGYSLMPEGRYAKMRNVWFIPSPDTLVLWLKRIGFKDIEILNISTTSTEEQRQTEWMQFESLADFLDFNNKTIEGYPAPKRIIIKAINND